MKIKLKSYDHSLLDKSCKKVVDAAQRTGSIVVGTH